MSKPLVPIPAGSPIMLSGPTGSGKTYWINRLLSNDMFTQKISSVLYCYGVYQPFFDQMTVENISFHEGVPDMSTIKELKKEGKFHVVVLDDLMEYIVKSIETQNLFTKYCHHYNISAIFITQNIFAKGPCARNISLNTHILVLFANKRDESQAMNIGKQLYPGELKVFMEAFEDATSPNFGYLVVDCCPIISKFLKYRTNIFPGEQTVCYMKKPGT